MEVRVQPQAPAALNPGQNSFSHWIGGWMIAGTGGHLVKEISCPCGKRTLFLLSPSL